MFIEISSWLINLDHVVILDEKELLLHLTTRDKIQFTKEQMGEFLNSIPDDLFHDPNIEKETINYKSQLPPPNDTEGFIRG